MPRFHDARFSSSRFDSTPADTAWPSYLKQEHGQDRFTRVITRRSKIIRRHRLERLRQRPPSAWMPTRHAVNAPPVMKVPWRIWTIRR